MLICQYVLTLGVSFKTIGMAGRAGQLLSYQGACPFPGDLIARPHGCAPILRFCVLRSSLHAGLE